MDLKNFIQASGLDFNAVAAALFPDNAKPYWSLYKLIKDGRELKESQIIKLSQMSGTPPEIILGLGWKGILKDGFIEVSSQGYTAKYKGGETFFGLYKNGELLARVAVDPMLSVKGFMHEVKNSIINNLKLNSNA